MNLNDIDKIIEFCNYRNYSFKTNESIIKRKSNTVPSYKDIQNLIEITEFLNENNIKYTVNSNKIIKTSD